MTFMSGLAAAPEHFAPTGKGFDILHYFYNRMFFPPFSWESRKIRRHVGDGVKKRQTLLRSGCDLIRRLALDTPQESCM